MPLEDFLGCLCSLCEMTFQRLIHPTQVLLQTTLHRSASSFACFPRRFIWWISISSPACRFVSVTCFGTWLQDFRPSSLWWVTKIFFWVFVSPNHLFFFCTLLNYFWFTVSLNLCLSVSQSTVCFFFMCIHLHGATDLQISLRALPWLQYASVHLVRLGETTLVIQTSSSGLECLLSSFKGSCLIFLGLAMPSLHFRKTFGGVIFGLLWKKIKIKSWKSQTESFSRKEDIYNNWKNWNIRSLKDSGYG